MVLLYLDYRCSICTENCVAADSKNIPQKKVLFHVTLQEFISAFGFWYPTAFNIFSSCLQNEMELKVLHTRG